MLFVDGYVLRRSVDFTRRRLDESLHSTSSCGLTKIQRALDVRVYKAVWSVIGVGDGNQRSQVKHDVDVTRQFFTEVGIANVAGYNFDLLQARNCFEPSPIVERIVLTQSADPRPSGEQLLGKMRTNEAVGSSHEDFGIGERGHRPIRIPRDEMAPSPCDIHQKLIIELSVFSGTAETAVGPRPGAG